MNSFDPCPPELVQTSRLLKALPPPKFSVGDLVLCADGENNGTGVVRFACPSCEHYPSPPLGWFYGIAFDGDWAQFTYIREIHLSLIDRT